MERLLFVGDIMERYHCTAATARKYMRQMLHMEKPLAVTERALETWENDKMQVPARPTQKRRSKWQQPPRDENGNYYIPRRRA